MSEMNMCVNCHAVQDAQGLIFHADGCPNKPTIYTYPVEITDAQQIAGLQAEVERLKENLLDVVLQACQSGEDIDSMAISSYADAMRILDEYGMIEIDTDHMRRVIAHLPESGAK